MGTCGNLTVRLCLCIQLHVNAPHLNDMHRKVNALASLFMAVVSLWTQPMVLKSHQQQLSELLSVMMPIYVIQSKSCTTHLFHSTPLSHFSP